MVNASLRSGICSRTVALRATLPKGVTGLCPEPRRYGLLSHQLTLMASASA